MDSLKFKELNLTYMLVSELKENQQNPRTHSDKQIKKLEKSIEMFGFNVPLVVDKDGVIISGNAALRAAKNLGLKEVPTVKVEHLTGAKRKAFILAVNKIAEESGWDNEILRVDFQVLIEEEFDLSTTGFEIGEIDVIMNTMGKITKACLQSQIR